MARHDRKKRAAVDLPWALKKRMQEVREFPSALCELPPNDIAAFTNYPTPITAFAGAKALILLKRLCRCGDTRLMPTLDWSWPY